MFYRSIPRSSDPSRAASPLRVCRRCATARYADTRPDRCGTSLPEWQTRGDAFKPRLTSFQNSISFLNFSSYIQFHPEWRTAWKIHPSCVRFALYCTCFVPSLVITERCWNNHLQLQTRFSLCWERQVLPVRLLRLLPHHHVEAGRVLVGEDEAHVVIVTHRVHVKRALEINTVECRVAWRKSRRDADEGWISAISRSELQHDKGPTDFTRCRQI